MRRVTGGLQSCLQAQSALAGELGFEPRLTESESAVLPLNYSPLKHLKAIVYSVLFCNSQSFRTACFAKRD
jgi:hypothetical protein